MAPPAAIVLLVLVVAAAIVALIVWAVRAALAKAERERQARMALAQRLGLRYEPKPTQDLVGRYSHLQAMPSGVRRYAEHLFEGTYRGVGIRCFDYTYVTQTTDHKGNTHYHYHHVGVAVAEMGENYPRLTVVPESWGHKLWDALGGDDIDFESDEFSRRFWVKSEDRKFAYDVLHARAMEYLLAPGWRHVEVRGGMVAMWSQGRVRIDEAQAVMDRLVGFIDFFPGFLRGQRRGPTASADVVS